MAGQHLKTHVSCGQVVHCVDQMGVIAEFVPKRTLSSIEERRAGISQRPKPILERFGRPDVIAIKTDVSRAEWSDVGRQRVGQNFALDAKLGDGAAEIDGVPEGDDGDREVETRGPVALIFEGAVPDLAVTMEKQGTGQRVSSLLVPLLEFNHNRSGGFEDDETGERAKKIRAGTGETG